jgi:hypothetical protein
MASYSADSSKPGRRLPLRALTCLVAATLLAGVAGCASQSKAPSKASVPASEIKIYQTPDLLRNQYTLVEHVWTDSWRSNVSFPSFKSEADGIEAMKRAASSAGANALIHVICLDTRSKPSQSVNLNCYGDAIRVN